MYAPTPDEIFDAACSIRPELSKLLGENADAFDQQLSDLLNQDRSLPGLDNHILKLLTQNHATRSWVNTFLKGDEETERGREEKSPSYQPPLKKFNTPIPLPKFACPHGDYIWTRHSVGEEPPLCPTHKVALKRVKT